MDGAAPLYSESIFQVGLVPINGILTKPARPLDRPAIVVLNSGLLHHIGSCRISVAICRQLATLGFTCVRFDFSGIGDSPTRDELVTATPKQALGQLQEVFDYLEKQEVADKFLVGGLCSGADWAFHVGAVDDRVAGIFQIDPYLFRTPQFYLRHYFQRLLKPGSTLRWLRRKLGPSTSTSSDPVLAEETRFNLTNAEVSLGYQVLLDRGVKILAFVTGEQTLLYNYKNQFFDMFRGVDFGANLDFHYCKTSSHMMLEPEPRHYIESEIAGWASRVSADNTDGRAN